MQLRVVQVQVHVHVFVFGSGRIRNLIDHDPIEVSANPEPAGEVVLQPRAEERVGVGIIVLVLEIELFDVETEVALIQPAVEVQLPVAYLGHCPTRQDQDCRGQGR